MIYEQLSIEYKYNAIADAVYAREVEYFHYDLDRKNFEYILANGNDNEFAADVQERLFATVQNMNKVRLVLAALKTQIDDPEAYEAAVVRVTAKRKAKESEG
jgi:hypothetical protein